MSTTVHVDMVALAIVEANKASLQLAASNNRKKVKIWRSLTEFQHETSLNEKFVTELIDRVEVLVYDKVQRHGALSAIVKDVRMQNSNKGLSFSCYVELGYTERAHSTGKRLQEAVK